MIARRAENPIRAGDSAAAGADEEERPGEALAARPTTGWTSGKVREAHSLVTEGPEKEC